MYSKILNGLIVSAISANISYGAEAKDAELLEAIRVSFESLKVEEFPMEGTSPDKDSMVIRRSWSNYAQTFPYRRIILFSGHEGGHRLTYGTAQGQENYMIDQCWWEVKPDAVLDTAKEDHMNYIPSNVVDEIVADDERFLRNEQIPFFARMLKSGGTIVFKPGNMGWPAMAMYKNHEHISDCGRYGAVLPIGREWATQTQDFRPKAIANANTFYKTMGFSTVVYDDIFNVFVLTKG